MAVFKPTYSCSASHVSERQSRSRLLSDIISFTNTPLWRIDLIFKTPHEIVLFCGNIALVLICTKFLCTTPCALGFVYRGRVVCIVLICRMGDCSSGSTEKRVRLQLCSLVPTLGGHGFAINVSIFLEMSRAPSQVGCMPSLPIRPVFPSKEVQWFMKPTLLSGHHLDNQRLNEDIRLYISSLIIFGRGPEKIMVSDIVFA